MVATAQITHRVECIDLTAHLFCVTLCIEKPASKQQIALPVWIPGSYMIREFAKQLQGMTVRQAGKKIVIQQFATSSWQLDCKANQPVEISYFVYAFDASVRTTYLDTSRGFFNGTSLFMRVLGQESSEQQVVIELPKEAPDWRVATALTAIKVNKKGWGIYQADHYDELADSPFELGDFWQAEFTARGVVHRLVVSGAAPTFDGKRLLADTQTIVEAAFGFWHGAKGKPPASLQRKGYVFMLYASQDGYGGLEHKHSTALIAKRSDLPRLGDTNTSEGYITLLGLISHEYFHTWNVKRLRPSELAVIDYQRENPTQLLWLFEGFTSYFDDLLLRRAGLITEQQYLSLLAKTVNQVLQTPGRLVHPLSSSSFEAWTKYYRPDENSVNSTVSYYTKGALVALCLDLSLRKTSNSLDEVMRALWVRTHQNGNNGVMCESDLLGVLQVISGRSFAKEIQAWVHGTQDLPLTELLATVGIETSVVAAPLGQQLGLRLEAAGSSIKIKSVLSGSLAAKAGFSAGDEWLAVEVADKIWRIHSMDDLPLFAPAGKPLVAWVTRECAVHMLKLSLPKNPTTNGSVVLQLKDTGLAADWLKTG